MGSSPLARGTPAGCPPGVQGGGVGGLIPARAGNTGVRFGVLMGAWAHPRSRGEHWRVPSAFCTVTGSSPLARGTHSVAPSLLIRLGLIPARAGNTAGRCGQVCGAWAHPRSRGEHFLACRFLGSLAGSSPLARGTRGTGFFYPLRGRLIPARAGNTIFYSSSGNRFWAHPRSRGEHTPARAGDGVSTGSSPLARGTLAQCARYRMPVGLIPARAGNTGRRVGF